MRGKIYWGVKINGLIALICVGAAASAAGSQLLHGHVPEVVSHLRPLGRVAGTEEISLAISLPLRNQAALTNFLEQLYNPAGTNFHQYLTPEQFTERFGPTAEDYEANRSTHINIDTDCNNDDWLYKYPARI